jgi:outer membrane protein assembly factor BamB
LLTPFKIYIYAPFLLTGLLARSIQAAEASGAEIFVPEEPKIRELFDRSELLLARGSSAAAAETMARLSAQLLTAGERQEEGAAIAGAQVINAGAGYSIGASAAVRKLVARLPKEEEKRWRDLVEAAILSRWDRTGPPAAPLERRILRRRIIRDYPDFSLFPRTVEEEIDDAMARGNDALAIDGCRALLQVPGLEPAKRLRGAVLGASLSELFGRGADSREFRGQIKAILDSAEARSMDSQEKAQARRVLESPGSPRSEPTSPPAEPRAALPAPAPGEQAPEFRLGSVVWRSPFPEKELRSWASELIEAKGIDRTPAPRAAFPRDAALPFIPTSLGGVVYFQDYQRVLALRVPQLEELWTAPLPLSRGERVNSFSSPAPIPGLVLATQFERILAFDAADGKTRWEREATYDRSRRRLVFLPPGQEAPAAAPPVEPPPPPAEEAAPPPEGSPEKDPETAKKEKGGDKQPEQQPVVDLSAPVLIGGGVVLTAIVRVQDEVQVLAVHLDLAGALSWCTSIGSFRSSNYLGQVAAACPPLAVGTRIFIPSNLGVVAALDSADGAVLWIQEYPRLSPSGREEAVQERSRWSVNPLVAGGGGILCAPQDSDLLISFAPEDGSIRWRIPRDRHSTLIGADAERAYLGGPAVAAVRLAGAEAGATDWSFRLPAGETSLGRAVLRGDRLLVPGNVALVELEARSGKVLSTTLWDFRGGGGNILLQGDFLAVSGPGEFMVYDSREQALKRAARLPEEEKLLLTAKLALKCGRPAEAFEALAEWDRMGPAEPGANSPIYRLRFEVAEIANHRLERFGGSREVPEAEIAALHRYRVLLEPLPERKIIAAIQAAAGRRSAADFPGAIASLELALRLEIPATPYPVNDFLTIPAIEAIRDQLTGIRTAGPEGAAAFAGFEARGQEVLREARRIGTQPTFRRVIDWYPFTRAAQEASLDLADYLLNQQNAGEAIRCLLDLLRDNPQVPEYSTVKLRVSDLLMDGHRNSEARKVLQDLLRERAEEKVLDPGPERFNSVTAPREKETVRELVTRRLADPRLEMTRGDELVPLRFPLRMRWRAPASLTPVSRSFLAPEGPRPAHLAGMFFTQSREVIECRRVDDGFPLWTVNLTLVPGFSQGLGASPFAPASQYQLVSRFEGDLLLLKNQRNLLAVDSRNGRVAWHKPFGRVEDLAEETGGDGREAAEGLLTPRKDKGRGRILPLAEMVRGFTSGSEGVFVTSSQRRIRAFNADGSLRWERSIEFEPAPDAPPVLEGDNLAVWQEGPLQVHFFDPATGEPRSRITLEKAADARFLPGQKPIIRQDGLALVPTTLAVYLVDLRRAELAGSFRGAGNLQRVWYFPSLEPDQMVIHLRTLGLPVLLGVDLRSLREIWRYDKLPSKNDITLHHEGSRFYIISGQERDRWNLLALELRPASERGRWLPVPVWPKEIPIGTFFPSMGQDRKVLFTQDAVVVPDPTTSSVLVFDKFKGTNRTFDLARPIIRFLRDKHEVSQFAIDVIDGRMVVLAAGGDCAFDSPTRPDDGSEQRERTLLVRRYLEKPDDWDNVGKLASHLFLDGESQSAIRLLDRSLLSEGLPSIESPGKYQQLAFLLNGLKEEAEAQKTTEQRATIPCRRFRTPPRIDGELNDPWNSTSRIAMRTLESVRAIPAPGQGQDSWVGEEDLSADLYTGWDDEYFYFALDVQDSQIFPYDKGADFWKGDCLIIGIDPSGSGGFFQRSDLQLMTLALTVPKRKPPGKDGKDEDDEDKDDETHKPRGFFSVKKKDDNSGAIYEVALPWSTFKSDDDPTLKPKEGFRFGLSLLLTDDDSGRGATKTLSLNPCHLLPRDPKQIWHFLTPEYFPKVVLE